MSARNRNRTRGGPTGPPLFIGVGNDWRGDDGVGLHVVRELARRLAGSAECIEADGEGTRLIELWTAAPRVVLFDAISAGEPPGTVLSIDALAQELPRDWFQLSSHAFGLAEAVAMGKALGRLPGSLIIHGIQGATFDVGTRLSPAVRRAAKDLVRRIADEVSSGKR